MNGYQAKVIGLTGQTGAGKSTLSEMFTQHGIPVVNADRVARETMEQSKDCLMDLVLEFSTEVIHPDATLNREKLAAICFSDKKKLRRLNEITFPYIIEAIRGKLREVSADAEMVVLDAPTLYEAGMDKDCDQVVAVIADRQTRLERIIQRDNMTQEAAQRRVDAQNPNEFYTSKANHVVTNDGDLDSLRLSFIGLMDQIRSFGEPEEEQSQLEEALPEESPQPEEDSIEEGDEEGSLQELESPETL